MLLVVQVVGVLLLSTLIGLLLPGDAMRNAVMGATVVAMAAAGLAFWNGLWSTGHTLIVQTETYPSIHGANIAPGSLFPADENLLDAAEQVLPRNARVLLVTTPGAVGDSPEWISYQLSPRLFVSSIGEAQYVLVYGAAPSTVKRLAHLPVVLNRLDGGVVRARAT